MKNTPLQIGNVTIQPGEQITVALPTPELYTCTPIYIPVHVIHGKQSGPTLLVCGSMHGDEINGMAIIQNLLKLRLLNQVKGTLFLIPTINVYGMITLSRNLPDRRDLEGSFPGSPSGSFASRLAHYLHNKIFSHITHCIDLHTGEPNIFKLPQVRTSFSNGEARELANEFQAPVVINTPSNEGLLWLLREEMRPIPTIIYEVGEALRLDKRGIKIGVQGILRVMRKLHMLPKSLKGAKGLKPNQLTSDSWVRSPSSGMCQVYPEIGKIVTKGECIASISDPFGTDQKEQVYAPFEGVVIGRHALPILNEGEPIIQIGAIKGEADQRLENWTDYVDEASHE